MSSRIPVTVAILCHNEADNLPRCLDALMEFDEIVVVDDGSTDESVSIARSRGARVYVHPFISFAEQRNHFMERGEPRNDWILHLDADEVVTPQMASEIRETIGGVPSSSVGFFARKVMLGDEWLKYSAGYPVYVPRLVHRAGPRYYMRGHGEWIQVSSSDSIKFRQPMLHFNFSRGWEDWYRRHERYAEAEAHRILAGLGRVRIGDVFSRDALVRRAALRGLSYRLPARPFLRFVYGYVFKAGFLDGRAGLEFCLAMSRYERMIEKKLMILKK